MTAKKQGKEPGFEEELARLEALAQKMEQGDLPLDELMNAYDEGATLANVLQERLSKAKAHLSEVKTKKDGDVTLEPSPIITQRNLPDDLNE